MHSNFFHNLLNFAVFVSFFPHILADPIANSKDFDEDLSGNPKISQHTRNQIWNQYNSNSNSSVKITQTTLALQYEISRQSIYKKLT